MNESVDEFLKTWQKRKTGALPPVDLRVSCAKCGSEIIGDDKVKFTTKGLVCESCLKKPSRP